MLCPTCKSINISGSRYCNNCHVPLEDPPNVIGNQQSSCSRCGQPTIVGDKFCRGCGVMFGISDEYTQLITEPSENITNIEYMGFWIRTAAVIIDTLILTSMFLIILAISKGKYPVYAHWIVDILYAVLFIGIKGQTPGKMVMGIQVLDKTGNIPSIPTVILREVIGKFLSGLSLFVGYIWAGFDKYHRSWHDHLSGTFVVKKNWPGKLPPDPK